METLIAILRGINVGGRTVPMAELKIIFEKSKFKNIRTYIQSGNVIFEGKNSPGLATTIEKELLKKYKFDIPVIIRTVPEIESVIKKNPFVKKKGINIERLHVTFLAEEPLRENVSKAKEYHYPPDEFILNGKEVYLHCPVSYGETKLNNNFFENKLKVRATTRNWRTVNELLKIAEGTIK